MEVFLPESDCLGREKVNLNADCNTIRQLDRLMGERDSQHQAKLHRHAGGTLL